MKRIATAALAAILAAGAALAHDYTIGTLSIAHPRAFETSRSANVGGGYMTITNSSDTADNLVAVRAPAVERVELHLSQTDANGVARMIEQSSIEVPANGSVTLQPGGLHVMFIGLNGDPFEQGEEIAATLVFERAGELDVFFTIEARSGMDHSMMDHSRDKMTE